VAAGLRLSCIDALVDLCGGRHHGGGDRAAHGQFADYPRRKGQPGGEFAGGVSRITELTTFGKAVTSVRDFIIDKVS